jgi:2-dehydropantoate 2-reductase
MEIGALIGVIAELGQRLRIATPTLDTVLALVKARARAAGTYREEI